jgi:predicted enzyme related to lactoylglutathione lyase
VEGSRKFYGDLFGWEAADPDPEFGGYFLFSRDGIPVAGAMGDMGDVPANDSWKIYLNTNDIDQMLKAAGNASAQVISPAMAVADLGTQAVLIDPTGAELGAWQPGTFQGFTVLGENGTPSWFELHTREHAKAVDFYRSVFRWETETLSDSDQFRYTVMREPGGEDQLAGIMDASAFLPEGTPSHWSIYWEVDHPETTIAKVKQLGGSVVTEFEATPYGRLATVADPAGAQFKLHAPTV